MRTAGAEPARPDEPASYLAALVGSDERSLRAWRQAAESCRARLRRDPRDAGALRLLGRALSLLGEAEEGLKVLDRATALRPKAADGWTWRGQAKLLSGDAQGAKEDLDRAVAMAGRAPWPRLLRALSALSLGDTEGAARDLREAPKSGPARALAAGIAALLEGQRGRPERGVSSLDRALKAEPSPFLHAIRGVLRRGLDLDGAMDDLTRAARGLPTPWVLSQRADVLNRHGFYKEALKDLEEVSRLLPDSAQPRAQAANVLFDQAFYPEALEQLQQAIARSPADPALLARRSRFLLVLGRIAEAEADLRRVVALDPRTEQYRFERLQLLCLQGRYEEADAALARGELRAPFSDYVAAYSACRRGDYATAVGLFLSAARQADGNLAERARFYAMVARVLRDHPPLDPAGGPQFYLCGIGLHHPYQITVEILRALASCEVLYNNLGDPQVSEFLGLFRGEVRAVTRVFNEPAMGRVQRIVAGLRPGKATGFVTRIHPFIYRRIARDLVTVCEEKEISYRAFGAVSLTEISWALGASAQAALGDKTRDAMGLRVFDMCWLNDRPQLLSPDYATVVYCIAGPEHRRKLVALLQARFPKDHTVYLLAGSGDREQEVEALALRAALAPILQADLGAVLYVPPKAEESR